MDYPIQALGIMSGSSLDGLDLCFVQFTGNPLTPQWNILKAETVHIPEEMKRRLVASPNLPADELLALDAEYGRWMGSVSLDFLEKHGLRPSFVAVHGHTVFHRPKEGWSFQLGSAVAMNKVLDISIIDNFRNYDMVWGGQGAPLVPKGDLGLFPEYHGWVNLGGICNLTLQTGEKIIAGDVGPMNQVMNHLSMRCGKPFDEGGHLAASGRILEPLVSQMKQWPYFSEPFPKSLGNEDVRAFWFELVGRQNPVDELATFSVVMADAISTAINSYVQGGRILVSGGGAFNTHLIELVRSKTHSVIDVSDEQTTSFKEALVFAYLGWLRMLELPNVLHQATGAKKPVTSGTITGLKIR